MRIRPCFPSTCISRSTSRGLAGLCALSCVALCCIALSALFAFEKGVCHSGCVIERQAGDKSSHRMCRRIYKANERYGCKVRLGPPCDRVDSHCVWKYRIGFCRTPVRPADCLHRAPHSVSRNISQSHPTDPITSSFACCCCGYLRNPRHLDLVYMPRVPKLCHEIPYMPRSVPRRA
jgi:hypothetical protein